MSIRQKIGEFRSENTPEYILVTLLFWAFFVTMLIFAIIRWFGLLWFTNTTVLNEPHRIVKELVFFVLRLFECIFSYKLITNKSWFKCLGISIFTSTVLLFIDVNFKGYIDILFSLGIALICNKSVLNGFLKFIIVVPLQLAYSFIFLFARVDVSILAITNWTYNIIGIIDYKLFVVSLYLFIKLRRNNKLCGVKFLQ